MRDWLLAITLVCGAATTAAADCLDYGDFVRRVARHDLGSRLAALAVDDERAAVLTADWRLVLLDVADPVAPVTLGEVATALDPRAAAWLGDHVLVVGQGPWSEPSGCEVFLALAGGEPVAVGSLSLPGMPLAVAVRGQHALVASREAGLLVLDLADPAAPGQVAAVALPDSARGVAIAGDLALVAVEEGGVVALDVGDPAAPQVLDVLDLPGRAVDVLAGDGVAYVASEYGDLQVVDIGDPADLASLGTLPGHFRRLSRHGDLLLASAYQELVILDLGTPELPVAIGEVPLDLHPRGAVGTGSHALVAGDQLEVIDLADPHGAPYAAEVGGMTSVNDVVVQGTVAYLADKGVWHQPDGHLRVVDLTDPLAPVLVASLPLEHCRAVAVDGTRLYAVADPGVVVLDLADPLVPTELGIWTIPQGYDAWDLLPAGDHLYVTTLIGGLLVVDVSDPAAPVQVAQVARPGYSARLLRDGNRLYLHRLGAGIDVFSLADPAQPVLVATLPPHGYAVPYYWGAMALREDVLWVAHGEAGIYGQAVADLEDPRILGEVDLPGRANRLQIAGDHAYVACGAGNVQVVGIRDPQAPVVIGQLPERHTAYDLAVAPSGHLLVANQSAALQIGWPQCAEVTGVAPDEVAQAGAPALAVQPNPFNPRTVVRFALDRGQTVRLTVHDLAGRRVAELAAGWRPAGLHEIAWDGRDGAGRPVASGTYLLRLRAARGDALGRAVLIR